MLLVRSFERIAGQPNCGRSRPHSLKPMSETQKLRKQNSIPPRRPNYQTERITPAINCTKQEAASIVKKEHNEYHRKSSKLIQGEIQHSTSRTFQVKRQLNCKADAIHKT